MVIAYWKIILLTLAVTELAKDDVIKNRKILPWLAIVVSVVISLAYAVLASQELVPALIRGLSAGVITTGAYKLVKDYVRAILRRK